MLLLTRVKDVLLNPKNTWIKIKEEGAGFRQVLTGYAMPLAAIPAIFGLLGYILFGQQYSLGSVVGVVRVPFVFALIWAIVTYILILVGLYIEGIVINALAPSFSSKQNAVNALKLAVYAYTPAFVAGVLNIFPRLGILVFLISLYGIYLLYLGLPLMMETPKGKVVAYLVVTFIVMIIIFLIFSAVAGAILTASRRPIL